MNSQEGPICFAIMPFSVREVDLMKYGNDLEHWQEVYHGLIVPAITQSGLRSQRDDEDYSTRLVGEGIWAKIEQADLILCDMSSHNPNVHLELGWALRADKKIVLIKDEQTSFNFDLNQYYTYEYSSKLQPTVLERSVKELSKVIKATLADDVSNYSMVSKLTLYRRAVDAASKGSLEVELLQELLNEVRMFKKPSNIGKFVTEETIRVSLNFQDPGQLSEKIIGTTWRKRSGLEEIMFVSDKVFMYSSVGTLKWLENDVKFEKQPGLMKLMWRHDGYRSICRFDSRYSEFTEDNGERWLLIAKEPYVHPSFLPSSS
jgi:hypothetical protein